MAQPFRVEHATMAPDGRHVAYVERAGRTLQVVILDLDRLSEKTVLPIGEVNTLALLQFRPQVEARVNALRWATAKRLVYEVVVPPKKRDDLAVRTEVRAVDADGSNSRLLADEEIVAELWSAPDDMGGAEPGQEGEAPMSEESPPAAEFIGRRPRLVGLCTDKPDCVTVEATGGRDVPVEIYRINIFTGKADSVFAEMESARLICDQQGRPRLLETATSYLPKPMLKIDRMLPPTAIAATRRYQYRSTDLRGGWVSLEKQLQLGADYSFQETPANFYKQRAFPLGFGRDPNVLYFASNAGRDTYGIYAFDLAAKRRMDFAVEVPGCDLVDPGEAYEDAVLFWNRDRDVVGIRRAGPGGTTRWLDPKLAARQAELNEQFHGRVVQLIDWDNNCQRFLLLVARPGDPGRYFVVDTRTPDRLTEIAHRAPWLPAETLPATRLLAFDTPEGVHLAGTLTLPRQSRVTPPPLVVLCPDIPGQRRAPDFDCAAHLLASFGYAVAQVDVRGTSGRGARHRDALAAGFDRVPIEDVRATVRWLSEQKLINPRFVGLVGYGYGGYIAGRAVQLFPAEFRCGVTINGVTEPDAWARQSAYRNQGRTIDFDLQVRNAYFGGAVRDLAAISLLRQPEAFSRPLLIIQDAGKRDLPENQGIRLRDALKKRSKTVEYLGVDSEFTRGDAAATARAFSKIADFLNENIFSYRVDVGESKEVK